MPAALNLFSDGGARHNPGPAAAGYILRDETGNVLEKKGEYLGPATNNEAEYRALISGLTAAKRFAPATVTCFLDSELVVRQLKGEYRIKEAHLQKLAAAVRALESSFSGVRYQHIAREKNVEADRLVNLTLDQRERR